MIEVPLDLPWWPPPDGEPIGQERAEELVALLLLAAKPVVDAAEADLRQRITPGAEIVRNRAPLIYFINAHLNPEMTSLCVGMVYEARGGDAEQNSIRLTRAGHLTWHRD